MFNKNGRSCADVRGRESLLDNIEITEEERKATAERLRQRRLARRRQQEAQGLVDGQEEGSGSLRTRPWDRTAGDNGGTGTAYDDEDWGAPGVVPGGDPYMGWGDGDTEVVFEEKASRNKRKFARDRRTGSTTSGGRKDTEKASSDAIYDEKLVQDEYLEAPDIVILSPQELDRVLPVLPFAAQADFFNGGAAQSVQRWGASLAMTVLLSKIALLAATSLTWPLWWPWAQAARKNLAMRKQMDYGGIWRTQVLDVQTSGRPRPSFGPGMGRADQSGSILSTMRTSRIVIGEEEGAQVELVLPYDARFEVLSSGQAAEVVVLSDSVTFDSMKAVKDVYLPESGLWLSEYPYVDRAEFLEISLDIEQEMVQQDAEYY